MSADAIHGNKTQNARQRTLNAFRANRVTVLVATDVAARGLDVDGVSHVVNYDLPMEAETYVHRIGRTGRAGANGIAMSFVDREQRPLLHAIERLLRKKIPVQSIEYSDQSSPWRFRGARLRRWSNRRSRAPLRRRTTIVPRGRRAKESIVHVNDAKGIARIVGVSAVRREAANVVNSVAVMVREPNGPRAIARDARRAVTRETARPMASGSAVARGVKVSVREVIAHVTATVPRESGTGIVRPLSVGNGPNRSPATLLLAVMLRPAAANSDSNAVRVTSSAPVVNAADVRRVDALLTVKVVAGMGKDARPTEKVGVAMAKAVQPTARVVGAMEKVVPRQGNGSSAERRSFLRSGSKEIASRSDRANARGRMTRPKPCRLRGASRPKVPTVRMQPPSVRGGKRRS